MSPGAQRPPAPEGGWAQSSATAQTWPPRGWRSFLFADPTPEHVGGRPPAHCVRTGVCSTGSAGTGSVVARATGQKSESEIQEHRDARKSEQTCRGRECSVQVALFPWKHLTSSIGNGIGNPWHRGTGHLTPPPPPQRPWVPDATFIEASPTTLPVLGFSSDSSFP